MKAVELSARMQALADMVSEGSIVCDVGCDHGWVSIYLIQQGIASKVIAMDVGKGPLERAKEHIRSYHLENYIETRLSDGLSELQIGEADCMVCAGMGGPLMMRILTQGREKAYDMKELILQPQSEIALFRAFLRQEGYKVVAEDMVYEDGKYYPMMKVVPVEVDEFWDMIPPEALRPCDMYGPLLLKNGNPSLRKYLVKQHKQLNKILKELNNQPDSEAIALRKQEVLEEISLNESAYTILGEIKNAGI